MNDQYQGHLADGSSVQQHSAGPLYPCVLYAKQTGGHLTWGVISPCNQAGQLIGTYDAAVAHALRINSRNPVTLKANHE